MIPSLNCKAFSNLLLAVHEQTTGSSIETFKDNTLNELKKFIPFDTALWGTGTSKGIEVEKIHLVHLHNLPANFLESWSNRKEEDGVLRRILSEPDKAFTESDFLAKDSKKRQETELFKKHSQPYQIARALSMASVEPFTGLFSVISLYRNEIDSPFQEEERSFFQNCLPHLLNSCSLNQFFNCKNDRTPAQTTGNAICDKEGYFHAIDSSFIAHISKEWPEWTGQKIPVEIENHLARNDALSRLMGRKISLDFQQAKDYVLIQASYVEELDQLSKRESELIPLLISGSSYKEIGKILHISHSTVNKHVLSIYKKLNVSTKAELMQKMN